VGSVAIGDAAAFVVQDQIATNDRLAQVIHQIGGRVPAVASRQHLPLHIIESQVLNSRLYP
jgi:hypothetical protein